MGQEEKKYVCVCVWIGVCIVQVCSNSDASVCLYTADLLTSLIRKALEFNFADKSEREKLVSE